MTPETERPRPTLDLSLTQLVATTLGSVLAAALAARLRLAGTLPGAAVVTVVATVASALVALWLRRGRHRLSVGTSADPVRPDGRGTRWPAVVAGVVAGVSAAAVLASAGHPVLQVRVDAGAVEALQRGVTAFAQDVQRWLSGW